MKRNLSAGGCPSPPPSRTRRRTLQLLGSSSAVLKTGQDCLEPIDTVGVLHVVQGQPDMDREVSQSTCAYKGERGNTDRGFDLNATPCEPLGSDILSQLSRIDRTQQENDAQEAVACDDVGVGQPNVVENDDERTDFLLDDSAVQWFNDLFVDNESLARPESAVVRVELNDDHTVTLFSSPGASTQVQNQTTEVVPDVSSLGEESNINADSPVPADEEVSTRLTLSSYPLRRNISHGNLDRKQFAMSTDNGQQQVAASSPEPHTKEPKESTFTCPICWGPFVEEYSTICGHIFCHSCIKSSIKAQKKCPTCRRKLNKRNIHRVYLPVTI